MVFVSPEHDLVAVVRWIESDQRNAFINPVMGALVR